MNTMYRNLDGKGFEDYSRESGLGPPSRPFLGFGAEFLDFDNDGWLDLFVANGHVDDQTWHPASPPYAMRPQFFRNRGGGQFDDVSAWSGDYFLRPWLGRGAAVGDLDNDGDCDLAVSHMLSPSALLRNETPNSHRSIVLNLIGGIESNRSALHARIEAVIDGRTIFREIVSGGSFQSASSRRVHIGCGSYAGVESLKVRWPSGDEQVLNGAQAGAYIFREGDDELTPAPE
jgi:hypothetical protein